MAEVEVAQPRFALHLNRRAQRGGLSPKTTGTMCTTTVKNDTGLYTDRNGAVPGKRGYDAQHPGKTSRKHDAAQTPTNGTPGHPFYLRYEQCTSECVLERIMWQATVDPKFAVAVSVGSGERCV